MVEAVDFEGWLRRLVERRIDVLVTARPDTLEALWARDHPEIFEPLAEEIEARGRAYRIDRQAVRARVGLEHRCAWCGPPLLIDVPA